MGDSRRFFVGKRSVDLDMLLRQSSSYFYVRKFGKIDTTIMNVKQAIWNLDNTLHDYQFTDVAGGVEYFLVCDNLAANQLVNISLLDTNGANKSVAMVLTGQAVQPIRSDPAVPELFTRHQSTSLITKKDNTLVGKVYIFEGGVAVAGVPTDLNTVRGYLNNSIVGSRENRSQQGLYTIPTTHYGFFTKINAYFIKKQAAISTVEVMASFPYGAGIPFDLAGFPANQTDPSLQATVTLNTAKPDFDRDFNQSPELDPGTDIIMQQTADIAAAGLAIEYDIICIKKEMFGLA